jgi:peptide/nickel transport system substrate-binding protein
LVTPPQYKSDRIFYEFDLQKAATLLDEAGWIDSDGDGIREKDGVKLRVLYQTYRSAIPQETQNIIKKDMASIGIDIELKITDASIFFGDDMTNPNHNGRFLADMQEADWISPSPDPGPFFHYWTCEQIPQKGNNMSGNNFRRWCDPNYDALYKQSKTELDPDKRRQIFIQMNDMLTEEVVTIPLVRLAQISGINQTLEGFEPTPWDAETWNIKDWRRQSP